MSDNTFDTEEVNLQIQPLPGYIDADGSFKLNTPLLSSFDFDGSIPKFDGQIDAVDVKPGYLIQIEAGGQYFPVVSIEKEEADLEDSPSGIISIGYIDSQGATVSTEYEETDQVSVVYEDWANKVLGSQGWGITAGGNAIFTNIAARGRIEAEEGYISGTLTIGSGGATTINDLATTADLNGYIPDGSAAADIISNSTTITGGNIFTGTIQSQFYSYTSGLYSNNGMQIGLDGNGYIRSPNFYLDTSGNAYFKGDITAKSGYFGNSNYGMSIVDDGSTVTIRSTTLRMGSQNVLGTLHGSIDFYTTAGLSIGQISSAASNKTWSGLGDGIVLGTTSDYLFLPRSGNTTRSRYYGSGFEWYNTSGQTIMSIAGGTGGLRVQNNTGGIKVSGGGDIEIIAGSGGRFIGDGSGLTNLPGGAGGGVTSFKWGDSGLTETGAVAITGAEIITGINAGSITNGKLANSTIQIMSTTKSLGQSFVAGDIDGDVITANTLPPGKISNSANLFSIGGTGVARGNAITTISGPLTIGTLTVSTSLDYIFNLGTTPINLNRSSGALGATLGGVNISGSAAQLSNTTSLIGSTWGAQGGIIYNNNGILAGIGTGTSGQFLRSAGTSAPTWSSLTTAAGQIVIGGAGGATSTLPIGGANQILRVNSGATAPEWFTPTYMTNPMTVAGDIIYGGTNGQPTSLPIGSTGQILSISGGVPVWTNAPAGSGTVTSVGLSAPTSIFTVSNSPVTGAGTLTLSYTTTGGGDRNVLRSISNGAVAMGKINGAHCNFPGTSVHPFVRYQAATGDFHLTNANTAVSSIRFKKIVDDPINIDSAWIDNINTVKFKYNLDIDRVGEDSAPVFIGLVAEELAEDEVLKQIVSYDEDNIPTGVDYDKIPLLLLPLIKELRDKVTDLEARLDAAGL